MTFLEAMRTRADDVGRRRHRGTGWDDLPRELKRIIYGKRWDSMFYEAENRQWWRQRQYFAAQIRALGGEVGYGPGF